MIVFYLSLSPTALLPRTAGATYSPELIFRGAPTLFHWELLLFLCSSLVGLHYKKRAALCFMVMQSQVSVAPGVVDYYTLL